MGGGLPDRELAGAKAKQAEPDIREYLARVAGKEEELLKATWESNNIDVHAAWYPAVASDPVTGMNEDACRRSAIMGSANPGLDNELHTSKSAHSDDDEEDAAYQVGPTAIDELLEFVLAIEQKTPTILDPTPHQTTAFGLLTDVLSSTTIKLRSQDTVVARFL